MKKQRLEDPDHLTPPESHYVSAVYGWLGLGSTEEAEAELAKLSGGFQQHPDVLEARWCLRADQHQWDDALQIARQLLHAAPTRVSGWINQAYALRRSSRGGIQQAWEVLFPALKEFPEEPIIPYNLSCYACQLGRLTEARKWLERALALGDRHQITMDALKDEDLKPLWPELKR